MSRSDFLKLMGVGATALILGRFLDSSLIAKPNEARSDRKAYAQSQESWSFGPRSTITPVHLVILPTGKLLYVAGSGYHESLKAGPFHAQIIDPGTGLSTSYSFPVDFFCIGHNHLANGNVLLTGGTLAYDVDNPDGLFEGLQAVYELDIKTLTFTRHANMAHGRWYPSQVVLADGRVLILGGLDEYGNRNGLVEMFDPNTKECSILYDPNSGFTYTAGVPSSKPNVTPITYGGPGQGTTPFVSLYPRMHLMPSGLICVSGMQDDVYMIDPDSGVWTPAGTLTYPWRDYGSSFLLPLQNTASERGKVMVCGGAEDFITAATATAEIIDFNQGAGNTQPAIRTTAPMNHARHFQIPITLPTGQLICFHGTSGPVDTNYVLIPDMFDPVTETWTELPAGLAGRTYHGSGVLLPDGRVFLASSTPDRINWETRTEIFSPSYVFAERPAISGIVSTAPYGGTIRIPTPDPQDIVAVSLVRLIASTHHYDPNMRLVWLQITNRDPSAVLVRAPINGNIAPPGPYYIHVINSAGIPSVAKVIYLPGNIC